MQDVQNCSCSELMRTQHLHAFLRYLVCSAHACTFRVDKYLMLVLRAHAKGKCPELVQKAEVTQSYEETRATSVSWVQGAQPSADVHCH